MKTMIKGHIVSHEQDISEGVRYLLYDLNAKEAEVFFNQAFSRGFAFFEDQRGNNYKLILHGPEYQLVKA